MGFLDTIEGYLDTKNLSNRNVYAPRIYSFVSFLQNEKNVTDKNYIEYLSALKIETILESLEYFIRNNQIKKKSVARFYAATIKLYFHYLYDNGIENENLKKLFAYTNSFSYDNQIHKYIEKSSLKDVETKSAIDFEEMKILITEIDEQIELCINDNNILTSTTSKSNSYNNLVYLLALKLMMFTGVDYKGLRDLPFDCFISQKLKIIINTYTLHLPDKLGEQLKIYEEIKISRGLTGKVFFILSNGQEMSKQTSGISDILEKSTLERGDTLGIRKFVLTEMIRNGINQSFIMKLTGVGLKIFEDCQDIVNTERNIEANRYIDSKMRDMITFDYL